MSERNGNLLQPLPILQKGQYGIEEKPKLVILQNINDDFISSMNLTQEMSLFGRRLIDQQHHRDHHLDQTQLDRLSHTSSQLNLNDAKVRESLNLKNLNFQKIILQSDHKCEQYDNRKSRCHVCNRINVNKYWIDEQISFPNDIIYQNYTQRFMFPTSTKFLQNYMRVKTVQEARGWFEYMIERPEGHGLLEIFQQDQMRVPQCLGYLNQQEKRKDTKFEIFADFQSGNIGESYRKSEDEINILLRPDTNGKGNIQWNGRLFKDGMQICVKDSLQGDGETWERGGEDYAYYKNDVVLASAQVAVPVSQNAGGGRWSDNEENDQQDGSPTQIKRYVQYYQTLAWTYQFTGADHRQEKQLDSQVKLDTRIDTDNANFQTTRKSTSHYQQSESNPLEMTRAPKLHANDISGDISPKNLKTLDDNVPILTSGQASHSEKGKNLESKSYVIQTSQLRHPDSTTSTNYSQNTSYTPVHSQIKSQQIQITQKKIRSISNREEYTIKEEKSICETSINNEIENPFEQSKTLQIDTVKICYQRRSLCHTRLGLPIYELTVTAPVNQSNRKIQRKIIIVIARQHPGETPGSFVCEGFIKFILEPDNPQAILLRELYVFQIIPMMNPDGVVLGNSRCSISGEDLNRRWSDPDPHFHPQVFYTKEAIKEYQQTHEIQIFCDLHGHSQQPNSFVYGCNRANPGDPSSWTLVRLLPRILAQKTQFFNYDDCKFRVTQDKLSTARVVVWNDFHIGNSFTLETSVGGYNDSKQDNIFKAFSVEDLQNLGRDLGRAFLEYYVVSEQLKYQLIDTKGWLKPHRLYQITGKTAKQSINSQIERQKQFDRDIRLKQKYEESSPLKTQEGFLKPYSSFNTSNNFSVLDPEKLKQKKTPGDDKRHKQEDNTSGSVSMDLIQKLCPDLLEDWRDYFSKQEIEKNFEQIDQGEDPNNQEARSGSESQPDNDVAIVKESPDISNENHIHSLINNNNTNFNSNYNNQQNNFNFYKNNSKKRIHNYSSLSPDPKDEFNYNNNNSTNNNNSFSFNNSNNISNLSNVSSNQNNRINNQTICLNDGTFPNVMGISCEQKLDINFPLINNQNQSKEDNIAIRQMIAFETFIRSQKQQTNQKSLPMAKVGQQFVGEVPDNVQIGVPIIAHTEKPTFGNNINQLYPSNPHQQLIRFNLTNQANGQFNINNPNNLKAQIAWNSNIVNINQELREKMYQSKFGLNSQYNETSTSPINNSQKIDNEIQRLNDELTSASPILIKDRGERENFQRIDAISYINLENEGETYGQLQIGSQSKQLIDHDSNQIDIAQSQMNNPGERSPMGHQDSASQKLDHERDQDQLKIVTNSSNKEEQNSAMTHNDNLIFQQNGICEITQNQTKDDLTVPSNIASMNNSPLIVPHGSHNFRQKIIHHNHQAIAPPHNNANNESAREENLNNSNVLGSRSLFSTFIVKNGNQYFDSSKVSTIEKMSSIQDLDVNKSYQLHYDKGDNSSNVQNNNILNPKSGSSTAGAEFHDSIKKQVSVVNIGVIGENENEKHIKQERNQKDQNFLSMPQRDQPEKAAINNSKSFIDISLYKDNRENHNQSTADDSFHQEKSQHFINSERKSNLMLQEKFTLASIHNNNNNNSFTNYKKLNEVPSQKSQITAQDFYNQLIIKLEDQYPNHQQNENKRQNLEDGYHNIQGDLSIQNNKMMVVRKNDLTFLNKSSNIQKTKY